MRKLTKKIIVAVLSLAMVMGVMSIPTLAVAPTGDTILVAGKYQNWKNDGTDTTNVLTKQTDGTYSGTITIPADLESTDLQLLVTPGAWDKADVKLDNADAEVTQQPTIGLTGAAGTLSLVYDPDTLVLTVTGSVRKQIVLDEEFNIFGDLPGLNSSGAIADGVMVKNTTTGLYEYKITTGTVAKKYWFKILQDCDAYGWSYAYGENGKLTGFDNGSVTVEVADSEVFITIDPETKEVVVKVTAPEEPTTEEPTTEEPTTVAPTKGDEPTTAAPTKGDEPTTAADSKADSALKILDGADGKYDKTGTYAIRIDEAVDKLVEVLVDDKVVDKANYTVKSGSTIITFTEAYLATLSDGKHNVTVKFTTGVAKTTLEVSSVADGDVAGGDMIPAGLFVVMFACIVAVSVVIKKRKAIA